MPDTACGYNRQPVGSNWTEAQKECEQARWDLYVETCNGCVSELCKLQAYILYLNGRAECLESPEQS